MLPRMIWVGPDAVTGKAYMVYNTADFERLIRDLLGNECADCVASLIDDASEVILAKQKLDEDVDAACEAAYQDGYADGYSEGCYNGIEDARCEMARVHASKVTDWLGDTRCSNCKTHVDYTEPFCQHCGAALDDPAIQEY